MPGDVANWPRSCELVIRIPGEPFAQPRARGVPLMKDGKPVLKNGRPVIVHYDKKGAKNWKATAQGHMLEALEGPDLTPAFLGPVALRILAVFTLAKSHWLKRKPLKRQWHTSAPDADNVAKAVMDAAKSVLWLNDNQVARVGCTKIIGAQGEAPYVLLRVRELLPDEIPSKETT